MITLHALDSTPEAASAAARSLIADAAAADGSAPVSDQALLAVAQGQRDLRLFAESPVSERIVAAGVVGAGEIDLVVRPDERGRGVGTAALTALLAHADAQTTAGTEAALLAWSHGENPAADALLARAGFAPVRSLYRMGLDPALLPSDGRDPLELPLPDGYALHRFRADTDAADWVRVNAAAFASHPEQGRITEADFALMRDEPWFDPADLIMLTTAQGNAVGFTWIKTLTGAKGTPVETELYAVGVDPAAAGRGLGRVLLNVTLARMAEHAPARVTLYVDGENDRAVRLYETAGFTIDSRSRQWARGAVTDADARMNA